MNSARRRFAALALATLIAGAVPGLAQETKKSDEPKKTKEELEQEKKVAEAAAAAQKELWKTVYPPTHIPDRVILTWSTDPATTQAVTWRTDTAVTKAVAQIARSEGGPAFDGYGTRTRPNPEKVTTVDARTELVKSDLFESHYHSAGFTGLAPKTHYVYRVGDGKIWSEWFEFRTASRRAGAALLHLLRGRTERGEVALVAGRSRGVLGHADARTSSSTPATSSTGRTPTANGASGTRPPGGSTA